MSDTFVTVAGNITRDPELRFTQGGLAVASFGIALNKRTKQADGSWKDGDPTFLNVTAFRQLGENAAASLHKGDRVIVQGNIDVRQYEKDDGTKGTSVSILADDIGASVKWATVEAARTSRSSTTSAPAGDQPYFGGAEEPF